MSAQYKAHMLKCIAMEPRTLLFFTEGEAALRISARHIERYATEMAIEGLIFRGDDRYFISDLGRAELNRPPTTASTRVWGPCSTERDWKPKPWLPVREGGEDHRKFASKGMGA